MTVAVSYPGVYIQEVPSGVRTITGVATSIAAFLGYTARGDTDSAVRIFNFGDFERNFGGLHTESPLSYAVQHFFLNGGTQAWIVRVADGTRASIGLRNFIGDDGIQVLTITARSEGVWGNALRLDVDYDTANPLSLFNLTVTEFVDRDRVLQPARRELHRNLSMNSRSPTYVVGVVEDASEMVEVSRLNSAADAVTDRRGTSTSGELAADDLNRLDNTHHRLAITIDEDGPHEFDLLANAGSTLTNTSATLSDRLDNLAESIRLGVIHSVRSFSSFTCARRGSTIVATSPTLGERSSVRFSEATQFSATSALKLGTLNGGREEDAAAAIRPAQTGTVGQSIAALNLAELAGTAAVNVTIAASGGRNGGPHQIPLWNLTDRPATFEDLASTIQQALRNRTEAEFRQAEVAFIDDRLRVVASRDHPDVHLIFSDVDERDTTATHIGLLGPGVSANVTRYAVGVGATTAAGSLPAPAQQDAVRGRDGAPPSGRQLQGSRNDKTGLYALEDVDLFNILCIPDLHRLSGSDALAVVSEAEAYVEERRAFFIIDLPEDTSTGTGRESFTGVQQWMRDNAGIRHKNAAVYFPRINAPDPLQGNRLRPFPNSGAVAGLFARTDAARSVWKAPAGTEATLRGVSTLDYILTDQQNGVLNQRGINALRILPAVGHAVWGARSLVGDDNLASEWKYIPVRRLALFLEESLYRGTQWVVFEPNDEPLWAQIRLNVGAFMQNLFRQGAFQGQTPREAYLVKCDAETTTQNDINLGIVNIVVGFAPLKPAEFVIITIQQLAGQIQV